MKRLKKIVLKLVGDMIRALEFLNTKLYMKLYVPYLRKLGVRIEGNPNYINHTVHLDSSNYSLIKIGDGCTISTEVLLLTHDGSLHTILGGKNDELNENIREDVLAVDKKSKLMQVSPIEIGSNTFIGARATLLPGTYIGKNVIVGACSVVKGNVPDNAIVVGNPAKIIGNTDIWFDKKTEELFGNNKGDLKND